MAPKFTDRPKNAPPQGAFGTTKEPRAGEPVLPRRPAAEPKSPPVQDAANANGPPARPKFAHLDEIQDEFDDFETTPGGKLPSSLPAPLGQSEGHDAWTVDRMSRQSTVPPERRDDVDRLRELSALPLGDLPLDLSGGALDLVNRSRPSQQLDIIGEMEELYALDDLTGALRQAEFILGRFPDNEQALRCAANCRARLVQLYASKLGPMDRVITVTLETSQLRWLGLDHRSGFLLSRVDGVSTVEEVLDICGMPRLEALKTLADLLERGAIRLD
ncbi:MAG TPA: hypothetical protein VJV78_43580 [Polyangiales bacterium]|nr:hypothetical protein [Polyangiales bacterium]